jgi:hypothetical protein
VDDSQITYLTNLKKTHTGHGALLCRSARFCSWQKANTFKSDGASKEMSSTLQKERKLCTQQQNYG